MKIFLYGFFFIFLLGYTSKAQLTKPLIYTDTKGVLRWTKDKKEAAFFGVNYTVPFAYGYRSHKALGIAIEKAIDADVHHMARLGIDAFRVHVWDVEITDSLGNLVQNEHLRLFDYLVKKLKEQDIKILITPIAFWGNGYPERDEKLPGFSAVYGKGPSVVLEASIKAQENYVSQLFAHVNPYTQLSYTNDPDIIAAEINNEPHHSGPKEKTTDYINRLTAAIKKVGWKKPVFYNISESPTYADAVVKSNVNGYSFQWYPTGLVAGHEQKGNFLPNVDKYYIPFGDTIPAFKGHPKMIYEFDAADIMQPIMYPAMARSYRTAGFQWATQFAYDPMATAYANTEYQTHYLNLAYTPAKAISLLIASKVFHRLPRFKSYGTYPTDTLFDVFRISYKEQLSEMNSEEEFYYSNSTSTKPINVSRLKHIAGVGNSPIIRYEGTGAYFLDKLADGMWRLEVMPDAITSNDPFAKASPKKAVTQIHWQANKMELFLPGFTNEINSIGLDSGNTVNKTVQGNQLFTTPGVYLISNKRAPIGIQKINPSFFAPVSSIQEPMVVHHPYTEVSAGKTFSIVATVIGVDSTTKVFLELRNSSNKWKTLPLQRNKGYKYSTDIPVDMTTAGVINYRIMVRKENGDTYTFPGGYKGDPYAWDAYHDDSWQVFVSPAQAPIVLFNPTVDRNKAIYYTTDWRNNTTEYISAGKPGQLVMKQKMNAPAANQLMGWQYFFKEKISGRSGELSRVTTLFIRIRSEEGNNARLSLITSDGQAFTTAVTTSGNFTDVAIPLTTLQNGATLLLPRPYPGFQPLWFTSASKTSFDIGDAEKVEVSFTALEKGKPSSLEVESIWLQ